MLNEILIQISKNFISPLMNHTHCSSDIHPSSIQFNFSTHQHFPPNLHLRLHFPFDKKPNFTFELLRNCLFSQSAKKNMRSSHHKASSSHVSLSCMSAVSDIISGNQGKKEACLSLLPTMRRAGHAPNLGNMLERWRANQGALLGKAARG